MKDYSEIGLTPRLRREGAISSKERPWISSADQDALWEEGPYGGPTLRIKGDPVNTNAVIFSHVGVEHWWTYGTAWLDQDGALFYVNGGYLGNQDIYFEAIMAAESGTKTCVTRIWNVTDGNALADGTVSLTGTTITRVRSAALTFPSGYKEYKVQFRQQEQGTAGDSSNTYAVRLVQDQT